MPSRQSLDSGSVVLSALLIVADLQVCEEWFNRMRPLLLRLSHATAKHTSTIGHAYTLLNMLKVQMRTFLAEPRPAEVIQSFP